MNLNQYLAEFQTLNVNKVGTKTAPHKAILLLSVMDMIQEGKIESNFILISEELNRRFKANWRRFVPKDSPFNCGMQYPFYHLSSSSFWYLIKTKDSSGSAPSSMVALKRDYHGAEINKDLFLLMQNHENREELRDVLISTYLSDSHSVAAEPLITALAFLNICQFLIMNA